MKESEIRPKEILDRYLELSLSDAQKMDRGAFVDVPCPACRSSSFLIKFHKNGFEYRQCNDCRSLYGSPRPDEKALQKFYEDGESSSYWAQVFFPAVAESRREKLFRPKAERIATLFGNRIPPPQTICDVGAGYGIFLEELRRVFPQASFHAIEPGAKLAAVCRSRGFETLEATAEGSSLWQERFDLVISSEVIEHVFSPEAFLRSLFRLAKPGGRVLLTGLGYEGFDILILQEKSKSVFPPHHINFMSVQGFETLCRNVGFRSSEIWTPGQLDVDIVLNSGAAPEFLNRLAARTGAVDELQSLLARHRLSSHIWVFASR